MATEQAYRERAKEARQNAAATSDETIRRTWLDVAKGFEQLADLPARDPVWRVERVEKEK
jgi:hypothetical protein